MADTRKEREREPLASGACSLQNREVPTDLIRVQSRSQLPSERGVHLHLNPNAQESGDDTAGSAAS